MERIGPGTLLAGRYRLEEQVQADPVTALWRAEDLTLERPVGVRVLSAEHARVQTTLDAARRAALVDDQRLQRVYGVGVEAGSGYVVLEWVTGQDAGSLAGKVSEAEAVRIVTEAAEALRTAATRQLHHGRLGPRQVVRASDGRVRVVGTGIEVAASGQPTPAAAARPEHRDVRDLSAVLYALATGSWPFGFVEGLLAAPTDKGRPVAARLLRDDLGEPLDRLLGETLAGNGPETLDALVQRLHAVRADLEATAARAAGAGAAGAGAAGAAGVMAGRDARETDDTDVITPVPAAVAPPGAAPPAMTAPPAASGPAAAAGPAAASATGATAAVAASAGAAAAAPASAPSSGPAPSDDPALSDDPAPSDDPALSGEPATGTSTGSEPFAAPASTDAPTRTRRAGVAGAVAAAAGAVAGAAGATAARMTGAGAGTAPGTGAGAAAGTAGAAGATGPGTAAGSGVAAAGAGAAGAPSSSPGRPADGTTPPAEVDLTAVEDPDRAAVSPTTGPGPGAGGRTQRLLPERDPRRTWGRGYQAAPAAAASTTPAWQSTEDDGWDLLPIGDDDYDETYADGPQPWDEQGPWDSQQPWDTEQWQDDASWEEVSGTGGTGGGGSVLPVTGASGPRRRPAGAGTGVAVVLLMGAFVVGGLVWALDRFRDSDEPVAAPTAVVTETVQPSPEPSAAPEPSEPAPSDAPQLISPAGVLALDPQGDGEENDADAPSAIDGDPASSWQTQRYNSQDFGGLKTGLGLAFDLGSPRDVVSVTVTAPGAGGTYEVRTAPAPGFDGSTVVATGTTGDAPAELAPETPVNSQFVIIWFTALPDNGGDWRGAVSELQVLVQ